MQNLRGTYVHRGDVIRRTRRVKQTLLVLGFCVATGVIAASREPATVNAAPAPKTERSSFFITPGEARKLQGELASTKGELDMVRAQFERATRNLAHRLGCTVRRVETGPVEERDERRAEVAAP